MKKNFLLLSALLFFGITNAQVEYRICLNTGLSSFGGDGASATSNVQINSGKTYGYTENPYGSNVAFCYGLSFDARQVTKSKFLYGANLGYEILRSKTDIIIVKFDNGSGINGFAPNTETTTSNYNITAFPYVGHRFIVGKKNLDLTFGFDVAYILGVREKGEANYTDFFGTTKYNWSNNKYTTSFDLRPRIQASIDFNDFGMYLGYSYGVINYKETKPTDDPYESGGEAFTRVVRIGATYKLF